MAEPAVIVPRGVSTATPLAVPGHARHRRGQPDVQTLAQPAGDEGADAALRHQVAARQHVAQPVAQR